MQINKVKIKNFMFIEALEFNPSTITIFEGTNRIGKTSSLEAIKHVMSHDHDPRRIGINGDFAEVTLSFDNGDIYRMKTTRKGTTWDFKNEKGEPILKSAAHLQALVDVLTLDPIAFVKQPPKEQTITFLKSVPMAISAPELAELGVPAKMMEGIDFSQHALAVIGDDKGGVYKRIYDERTVVNRVARENKAAAKELDKSIENVHDTVDAANQVEALTKKRAALEAAYHESRETQLKMVAEMRAVAEKEKTDREAVINAEYNRLLAAASLYKTKELHKCYEMNDAAVKTANEFERQINDKLEADYKPQLEQISTALGTATQAFQEAQKVAGIMKMRTSYEKKAEENAAAGEDCTALLEKLKALRLSLISNSPIPGLEVSSDGTLVYNGIPFEIINLAQKIEVALKIGQLRQKGECGIMIVDDLEHFDPEHLEEILGALGDAAQRLGLQIFGARVTKDKILTIGGSGE